MNTTRLMYQPTEKQEEKWAQFTAPEMPSDEEFQARWRKDHHGKLTGWGMGKRDFVKRHMAKSREYQMGIWQGRVDRARGLDYAEERNESTYNLGYYRGYTNYASDRRGWDAQSRTDFDAEYTND